MMMTMTTMTTMMTMMMTMTMMTMSAMTTQRMHAAQADHVKQELFARLPPTRGDAKKAATQTEKANGAITQNASTDATHTADHVQHKLCARLPPTGGGQKGNPGNRKGNRGNS